MAPNNEKKSKEDKYVEKIYKEIEKESNKRKNNNTSMSIRYYNMTTDVICYEKTIWER